jgi:DNA-binding GntR family transcriptional regulator
MTSMNTSNINTYKTKTEMVYEKLKEEIITGFLEQGEKIVAREVARQMGVSDIPVREALKKLESEGLVENIPHVGSKVSTINIKTASEIFAVRLELEAYAARLAAKNATASQAGKLQEIVDAIDRNIEESNVLEISRLNTEFHLTLYRMSRNETLFELILSLMERSQYSKSIFTQVPERIMHSNEEHKLIVNAIHKGNAEEAEKALRIQKEQAFAELLDVMERKVKRSE